MYKCKNCGYYHTDIDAQTFDTICPKCQSKNMEKTTISCPFCGSDLGEPTSIDISTIGWGCSHCNMKLYKGVTSWPI